MSSDIVPQRGVKGVNRKGTASSYAHEFKLAVVAYALKHTQDEAVVYFGLPRTTVQKWVKKFRTLDAQLAKQHVQLDNPYRGTAYGVQRRMNLSDKLFAELEHTVEVTRMKAGGFVPADVLQKLVNAYGLLVDKRRLEEGAHTALVQAVSDPQTIYQEGEAKVVEFRKRAELPPAQEA